MTDADGSGKLALGVGCERGTSPDRLLALVRSVLARNGLPPERIGCVASIDTRRDEPAVRAVADMLNAESRFYPAPALEALTPRLAFPSDRVFRHVGCHGVAEAAALAAAGDTAALLVAKTIGEGCTAAIAGPKVELP